MLFATYIQKLRNCIEPNTSRGEFTKKILKLIVTNEKKQEFESIRTDFIEKHNRLRRYYLSFPELRDIFEEMLSLSATLTFEVGFTNNAKNQAIAFQKEKYEKCIDKVWKALNE